MIGCTGPSQGLVSSAAEPAAPKTEAPAPESGSPAQAAAPAEVAAADSKTAAPAGEASDEGGESGQTAATEPSAESARAETLSPPSDGKPRLHAPVGLVKIHSKPDRDSPVIGAFRAGQAVVMTDTTLTKARERRRLYQCTEGWYPVEPRGFVCVGGDPHATRDGNDPRVIAARAVLPDRTNGYPFKFGVSLGTPEYRRIPTQAEQRATEPELDKHLANLPAADNAKGGAVDATPAGRPPSKELLHYMASTKLELKVDEDAFEGKKLSWAQEFDAQGRTWLLTPDMTLIPKDKVRTKPLPTLQGIDLKANPDIKLPLAFFWLNDSNKVRIGEDG
ncbi:MAG: hypothetical protein JRI68_31920, partial [Deltaproteobacteria bacterium]|nr:hypothetical protein [Deltaproteobacteria bacterium]